jgi:organic hydroperoxide reductase OsmC/OhrA
MCNAPVEFGGPGDEWSPESLLMAAVASCFVLTFRALARASKLEWTALECSSEGTLERADGLTRFTRMQTTARLVVPATDNHAVCERVLQKAERDCLIANSLSVQRELKFQIVVG